MWFDSHCHLHLCDHRRVDEILDRSAAAGVKELVTIGIDIASSRASVELAQRDGVYASIGLHPTDAEDLTEEVAGRLRDLAAADGVVAVGESGLDFYWDKASAGIPVRRVSIST